MPGMDFERFVSGGPLDGAERWHERAESEQPRLSHFPIAERFGAGTCRRTKDHPTRGGTLFP
jgi:hypothetical protein